MNLKLLCMETSADRLAMSRAAMYADFGKGLLPRPIQISARRVAIAEHELNAVIAARLAGRSDDEVRALVRKLEADRLQAA